MKSFADIFTNFKEFGDFYLLNQAYSTVLTISQKKASPNKKYIFKKFNFECFSPNDQKIILDTFQQINKKSCQYLLNYKYMSFTFPSENCDSLAFSSQSKLTPAFSMRYISSKTLDDVLKSPTLLKKWEIENYLKCLFAVAEAMLNLHERLICHGNLCPSNIIIDEADQFYLVDFGLLPIKKLYIEEKYLFNEIYKDPYMENNEPTFKNDVYSFGILMCELFFAYFQTKNKVEREPLNSFINNPDKKKFNTFPRFFAKLIPICLNSFLSERPSFKQIISLFQSTNYSIYNISIKETYNNFVNSNYLINLAAKGDSFALIKIGNMYLKGEVFKKDYSLAMEYYKKASDLNNSEAQNKYGVLLKEKEGNNTSTIIEGVHYLQLSAEQGNIHGMANYGFALLKGNGVEKNIQKAEEYLKKSADFGYSYAQVKYGLSLLDNNPALARINEGLKYIKKAMSQENAEAYYVYGIILFEGKFVEKNEKLSIDYFKAAADMGFVDGMIKFADCNMNGIGVLKNEKIALKYYFLAYTEGNSNIAKDKIDELTNNIENYSTNNVQIRNEKNVQNSFQVKKVQQTKIIQNKQKSIQTNKEKQQQLNPINIEKNKPKSNQTDPEKQQESNAVNNDKNAKKIEQIIDQQTSSSSNDELIVPESTKLAKEKQQKSTQDINEQQQSQNIENLEKIMQKENEQKSSKEELTESSQSYLSQNINLNLPSEELIKQGDEFLEKNDPSSAFQCYKEAACYGNADAYLRCANVSTIFNDQVKYYELAIKEQIPGAFKKWYKFLKKRFSLTNDKGTFLILARLFEKYNFFSEAANAYKKAKDIINFQICYEKAKKNIDDIEDGHQQYYFALLLKKQNEYELAMELFKKSLKNGISQAEEKIKEISQKQPKSKQLIESESLFEKGIEYYEGKNGMNIDYYKAYEYFIESSKLEYAKAFFYIGNFYIKGTGVKKDQQKAMHFYKIAADKDLSEAQFEYGKEKYMNGRTQNEKEEGISYLKKSAEKLYPDALYIYSQIIKDTNPEDSNKFYQYSLEIGSKLALKDQDPNPENDNEIDINQNDMIQDNDQTDENDLVNYSSVKEWRSLERDNLLHFISWFGWHHWEDSQHLSGLKRPIQQIKLASRAFLRCFLSNVKDSSQFTTAQSILEDSLSKDFDPDFAGIENAEESDIDFMKQPVMSDFDFIQNIEHKCKGWIKRIELLHYIALAVEKADRKLTDIVVPKCQGNLPTTWWTTRDDQCLIYGTWKHGFSRYDEMNQDNDIPFSYKRKGKEKDNLPPAMVLTPRIKKLVSVMIKCELSGGEKEPAKEKKTEENENENKKKKNKQDKRKEISTIYQNVRYRDFTLTKDGSPVMPIILTQTTQILSLGQIVTDRPGFHSERYIYPAGYKSSRIYASCIDPLKKVNYTCEIIDTGESNPLFRVTMDENPEIKFEGNAPSSPCRLLIKQIIELRKENSIAMKALAVSGPEFFGLTSPITTYLIQQMPGAKDCLNYIEKQFPSKWDKQNKQ